METIRAERITPQKIRDILSTMAEEGMIDAKRALVDKDYLIERILQYIQAANIARKIMNLPILLP